MFFSPSAEDRFRFPAVYPRICNDPRNPRLIVYRDVYDNCATMDVEKGLRSAITCRARDLPDLLTRPNRLNRLISVVASAVLHAVA